MQSLLKFNLNGGLKRMVSTLICLMMVLATFPIHMLKDTVCADGGVPINLTLSSGNGSEVKDWSNGELKSETVAGASNINITLSNNITVASTVEYANLPTMSTSTPKCLFDFTDGRFAGKTITIDGGSHTIKIDNASLFFLYLKDCKVILKNITIDGSGVYRFNSFIYVSRQIYARKLSELVIEERTTIQNCKSSDCGGAIYNSGGTLTMNGGNITSCSAGDKGGGIYNGATLTMNGGNITSCSADGQGGGIYNGVTLTMNGGTISGCSSFYGGGISASSGTVTTMNGGSITSCRATGEGDAIINVGILNLPPKEFGFLTITLAKACYTAPPEGQGYAGTQQCNHNDNPESVWGYEGIKNYKIINPISNYKIVFVDSKSGSTVGFAFGNKPANSENIQDTEKISIPDSVLARPGYEFVKMSYTKDVEEQGITVEEQGITVTDGKFTLDDDMLGTAVCGVITVKVKYNKLYTVQYVCDNKVVGTKSGCSENTTFSDIINTDFSGISLDGDQKLKDVVKPAAGYKFSKFTYGNGQTYTDGTTIWDDLIKSAVDGVITVMLNYTAGNTASDTVKYVASGGHMVLDKKSKLTNYSGVNLPIGGLRKVHEPKKVIFDFCGQTIHHNDPNVPFIQGVPGKHIVICNLNMDGSGCK